MFRSLSFVLICISASIAQAQLCSQWSTPQKVGTLDTNRLKEASGLALSKQFPDRFYHHNDSGSGGYFYVTDLSGAHTKQIAFTYQKVRDIEDISVGPCDSGQCIFLGDIGDNDSNRPSVDLWVIPETEKLQGVEQTAKKITLTYPDGPHNAESLSVHPVTGDVYILTKELRHKERRADPAKLFKLSKASLGQANAQLELVGSVDLPWINYNYGIFGQIATSMDISPDGKNLLVLTYDNAVEIKLDKVLQQVETNKWKQGRDYQLIPLDNLLSQQEAIAYSADGNSFYFDSEFNAKEGDKESPIYRADCQAR